MLDEERGPTEDEGLHDLNESPESGSLVPELTHVFRRTENLTSQVEALNRNRRQADYDHTRAVIQQLEEVAKVAKEAEAALSREVATGRVSTSGAKTLADKLAAALAALARALES